MSKATHVGDRPLNRHVGQLWQARWVELGLTQEQVAEYIGTDISTVRRYEIGVRFPWPEYERRLKELLWPEDTCIDGC